MTGSIPAVGLRVADRYVLTHRIASGGMGEVWRGVDDVLGREVAVKVVHRRYAEDAGFLTRFRAEARHAAPLSHPGIAAVFDYGESDDLAYLVMELVAGEPLSARLAREGALPVHRAVPLVQQAAAALQAAHEGGVVHRDIKPENLLLTSDDQVKITDFGIARAGHLTAITRTGEVVGTAQYLAPEQVVGQSATSASDIYSLAVVAYEMLTGRRPFQADSAIGTAEAHVKEQPPPLGGAVPDPVALVVLSALAKDPTQRPPTAARFGQALGTALTVDPLESGTPAMGAGRRWIAAAAHLLGAPARNLNNSHQLTVRATHTSMTKGTK